MLCLPARLQVESLQAQLGMARAEANSANQSLEEAKAEAAALEDTLGAVQAQRREVLQAKAAAEAQVAQLGAAAEELRASLSATAAQASADARLLQDLLVCVPLQCRISLWCVACLPASLRTRPALPTPIALSVFLLLQLEEVRAEFAAFRSASKAETAELRRQLAATEAERARLEEARASAASEAQQLQLSIAETKLAGTPQAGLAGLGWLLTCRAAALGDVRCTVLGCTGNAMQCAVL